MTLRWLSSSRSMRTRTRSANPSGSDWRAGREELDQSGQDPQRLAVDTPLLRLVKGVGQDGQGLGAHPPAGLQQRRQ